MREPVILAIDQGTSNTKALLVAADGSVLLSRARPMRIDYPRSGWAEQSASDIWEAVAALIAEPVAAAPEAQIAALAISNQRETVVLWEAATGKPVAPAVIWQCRRSEERCAALRAAGHGEEIAARSGLGLDPLFPAAKIAWLLDTVPDGRARAAAGELRCGTVDSWLLWNLTGGAVHATDHSNASRTQLFNLDTLGWDPRLAELFDVPLAILPEIRSSDSRFGSIAPGLTALPEGTPVHAMLGDSHAALFGHGLTAPGGIKATIGTGSSLMTATDGRVRSAHGLSGTIAWSRGGSVQHALEGNISVSGQAAAFATALLGLADEAALTDLAQTVPDNGGVVFVPALAGLGAPHWCSDARGQISGMSLGTRPAHIARAAIEAIALQIGDVFAAIEADLGTRFGELLVDGGGTRNALLMQMLADMLGCEIVRPAVAEAGAIGVARMASEALGIAPAVREAAATDRFTPALASCARTEIRTGWRDAITRITG
ncbi:MULTISPECIES: FGGY family carbohydrate kinase [unclassified Sphingopyxis]|uniref:FGGY family carbohydrate kinase n=1 Tax=unclassified Sphingopyxis TaxID=2614943 RepID=UPI000735EA33|nr:MULTISPECIES: FGGY family carbohydrate kinase [unclassified Sphingopyxis]KTE43609.1 glycerol kinase [Sphingopyxis sp. HIX]KTE85284.1 glycerol kinase [Sphingopyxis sp. HXXIV]